MATTVKVKFTRERLLELQSLSKGHIERGLDFAHLLTPIEALVLVEHYIETHFCKSGCEIDADNPLGADGYCEGCHEYGGEGCP